MSTLKSSSTDLTLNADGVGNDIIFQSNAGQVGSLTAEGVLTATSYAGSGAALTGLAGEVTGSAGANTIADNVVDEANLKISNSPTNGYVLTAQSGASGGLTWAADSTTDSTKLPLAGGALTGAVTTNSTFDGVDIATRDAILTSTTTTAAAALPKAGGTMTGNISHAGNLTLDCGGNVGLDADSGNVVLYDGGAQYAIFNASGGNLVIKSGATTAMTFANAAVTFASTTDTQGNAQFRKGITEQETAKTSSFTPDLGTDGTIYDVSGSITITMPSATAGKSFTIIDSGSGTLSWGGTILWPSATAPSPSGATIYSFISNGTSWYGMMAGTGFA